MEAMLTVQGFTTDTTVWVGRHWNYSYLTLLLEGRKKIIQGMYVDADLSEFYMGSASKNNVYFINRVLSVEFNYLFLLAIRWT